MKKIKVLIVSMSLILMSFCCNKEKEAVNPTDCSGAVCTDIFAMLNIEVKDSKGAEFPLDEVKVNINGKLLKTEKTATIGSKSSYTIFDDSFIDKILSRNSEIDLVIEGIKANKILFTRNLKVGTDCCHISLRSGSLEIVIP